MKMYGGNQNKENTPKKKKKTSRAKKVWITVLLILVAIGCTIGGLAYFYVRPPEIPKEEKQPDSEKANKTNSDLIVGDELKIMDSERKENFFNILIVGTDLNGYHTDSIMIASFDVTNHKVNVLSVPRDTIVNVKRTNKKLNAAYAVTGEPGNVDKLYEELESIVGFQPDKYVIVSTQGFVDMIDAIGGVTVDVQRNMDYEDPTQDLYIHIKKGLQTLNGYDSMCFMRYRYGYAEGDVGRVRAQQQFVKALMEKMIRPETLGKLPELCDIVMKNVKTDLSVGNLVWLGTEALKMNLETDLNTYILPGEGQYYKGISYFIPYEHKTLDMVNEVFNPYVDPIEDLNIIDFERLSGIKLGNG